MAILSPIPQESLAPVGQLVSVKWDMTPDPLPYEFTAMLCPEDEGGFSILALNYPGVISEGDTIEEAKANIAEAFLAMLEARKKHNESLQFSHAAIDVPVNATQVRIRVNA